LSFLRTLHFAAISLPIGLGFSLFLAILLNSKNVLGKNLFRTLFYMPTMIPVVAVVLIWAGVLNEQTGWINVLSNGQPASRQSAPRDCAGWLIRSWSTMPTPCSVVGRR
jgi:ABC-type sugar transport system permease subunit